VAEPVQYDALIVGGGPAGATCALWLKLLGLRPLLIERGNKLGGLQRSSPYPNDWIPGKRYASGQEFADAIASHLESFQTEVRLGTTVEKLISYEGGSGSYRAELSDGESAEAPYIVLATGVRPIPPDFDTDSHIIVGPGTHVFEREFSDRNVAILGGGDNAFENYLFVARKNPKSIRIFARSIRARYEFVSRVPRSHMFQGPYTVDTGRRRINEFEFDDLLVFYGWQCNNPMERFIRLEHDRGFIRTDAHQITSTGNVYAIGEMTRSAHPCVVTSMADGVIAAKSIQERLDERRVERLLDEG